MAPQMASPKALLARLQAENKATQAKVEAELEAARATNRELRQRLARLCGHNLFAVGDGDSCWSRKE